MIWGGRPVKHEEQENIRDKQKEHEQEKKNTSNKLQEDEIKVISDR